MPYTYVLSFSDLSSDTFNLSYSEYLTGSSMMMIFSHQTYMIFPTTYTFMIFCKTYRSLQFPDVCFNQFSIAKISGSSKVTAGTRFSNINLAPVLQTKQFACNTPSSFHWTRFPEQPSYYEGGRVNIWHTA
jgi:hypothetical protein